MKPPHVFVGDDALPLVMMPSNLAELDAPLKTPLASLQTGVEFSVKIFIHQHAETVGLVVWATVALHNYLRTFDEVSHAIAPPLKPSCSKQGAQQDKVGTHSIRWTGSLLQRKW